MNYYAVEAVPAPAAMLKKKVEIIGIYSPVGRSLKTSLALTYGQIRAREHKVLYLNLEEYAGFETLLEEKYEADLAIFSILPAWGAVIWSTGWEA